MHWGVPWVVERERYRSKHGDQWHDYFAWHPIKLADGTWVWLETIERRYMDGMTYWLPDYRRKTSEEGENDAN